MRTAFNIVMRIFSTLLGLFVILMGLVWLGQGLHVGPPAIMHGFMVSDWHWALYGAILAALGVGQVVWTNMRKA
jgi:MFS superfamily sulfate permease-like transporter